MNKEIIFYCVNNLGMRTSFSNCLKHIDSNSYFSPSIVLFKNLGWNDYHYITSFTVIYLDENGSREYLGEVKIIQSGALELETTLPNSFNELDSKIFFSKGDLTFYNNINKKSKLKTKVLNSLNDVYFKRYKKEDILKIDPDLKNAYEKSLFRNDSRELNVSSEYARNALETLEKIKDSATFIEKSSLEDREFIFKLLFGSVITTLESYLGDAFKYNVINKKSYFQSFLLHYDFKSEKKYTIKELGSQGNLSEFLELKVKEIMDNIIFHKLPTVKELYKDILFVELDSSLMDFSEDVRKRHDIFHRNGKNIAGIELEIGRYEIDSLIRQVENFISETEKIISAQTN